MTLEKEYIGSNLDLIGVVLTVFILIFVVLHTYYPDIYWDSQMKRYWLRYNVFNRNKEEYLTKRIKLPKFLSFLKRKL